MSSLLDNNSVSAKTVPMGIFKIGTTTFILSSLESIRILGTVLGYYDMDCEPMGQGFRVRARMGDDTITLKGETWADCLEQLLDKHGLTD